MRAIRESNACNWVEKQPEFPNRREEATIPGGNLEKVFPFLKRRTVWEGNGEQVWKARVPLKGESHSLKGIKK